MARTLQQILSEREGAAAPELVDALGDGKLQCHACGHRCKIPEGRDGICRVRRNVGGQLRVPRGYVAGIQVDPIEKKPFFHVLPGNDALSFGMLGCDLHCAYCFPADVRVATTDGMKRIGELFDRGTAILGDEETRLPPEGLVVIADDGSRRHARRVFRHAFAGELVRIETRFLPGFEATPDHPVLVTARPGEEPPRFVSADEVEPGMFLVVPRRHAFDESRTTIDVAAVLEPRLGRVRARRRVSTELVAAIATLSAAGVSSFEIGERLGMRADHVRNVRSRLRRRGGDPEALGSHAETLVRESGRVRFGQERRPGIHETIPVDAALAELFGLYCAEGCVVASPSRPNSRSLVFAFGLHEEKLARRARFLLRKIFGVDARESIRRTTRALTIGKGSLGVLFEELCGSSSGLKRVPIPVLRAERTVAESFVRALVAGNGHRYADGKVTLTTVSEDLAWDLAWLVLQLGWLPSVYIHEMPDHAQIEGRTVRRQPRQFTIVWRETETKRRLWRSDDVSWFVPVRAVSRRSFEGWVYNLEAEGRHTYLANGLAVHNCQNWVTSQALRDESAGAEPRDVRPSQLVELALREKAPVVVSTYNEPLITAEWAAEVFAPAHEAGLLCGFVSNGNATERVLDFLKPWLRLYKIDLKSFDDKHYRSLGAPLEHILDGLRWVHARGLHLEVVSLLIPGFNDSDSELRAMAKFLRELSPDIPWHVTAYHEDYKMGGNGDTPASTLLRACEIGAAAGLNFVYAGNRPGQVGEWENTRCPGCRATLIRRVSFRVLENRIGADGRCPDCARAIPGIWDHPLRRDRPATAPALPRRIR